jgi:hypothetical protein
MLRYLEIPAALPVFLGGLRIGATLSVIGAVVGEFVGADRGLGFLISVGRGQFDTALVFVAVFTLVIMALACMGWCCCWKSACWAGSAGVYSQYKRCISSQMIERQTPILRRFSRMRLSPHLLFCFLAYAADRLHAQAAKPAA